MGYAVQSGSTSEPLLFLMVLSSDNITGATGKTPTVTISKNGAAFATPSGAVTEVSHGWYRVAPNASDNGTLGPLLLHADATGCDPCDDQFDIVDFNPLSPPLTTSSTLATAITANQLIADALMDIGALGDGESLPAASGALGLRYLNRMLDTWATQKLTVPGVVEVNLALSANDGSYTIGIGGDIDRDRPVSIQNASFVWTATTPNLERPAARITADQWAQIQDKTTTTTWPWGLYNDQQFPLSTLHVWPIPTVSTVTLRLYLQGAIASFANLTTAYSFAPAVVEALLYNLAKRLCRPFGRPMTGDLIRDAAKALNDLKRLNQQPYDLVIDPMFSGGGVYDFDTDTVH